MPLHANYVIKAGSTSRSVFAHLHREDGRPLTGQRPGTTGLAAAYQREGEAGPHALALVPGSLGRHVAGGFTEVDPDLLPGVYELNLPDAVLAPGSVRTVVMVSAEGAVAEPIEIDLVAYDPQDERCIGMSQLGDERRHQFLRRALPRMTELELELGEAGEQELAGRSSSP